MVTEVAGGQEPLEAVMLEVATQTARTVNALWANKLDLANERIADLERLVRESGERVEQLRALDTANRAQEERLRALAATGQNPTLAEFIDALNGPTPAGQCGEVLPSTYACTGAAGHPHESTSLVAAAVRRALDSEVGAP